MFPSFSQIKKDAKECLRGIWGRTAWKEFILFLVGGNMTFGVCLYEIIGLIIFNLSVKFSSNEQYKDMAGTISLVILIHLAISFIRLFLASGLKIGMKNYYMELARDPSSDPKSGLTSHIKYFSSYFSMISARDIYVSLLAILFFIPGVISYLKWSMAPYIVAEDYETRSNDAFVESGYLMDGHKMKYFLFNLSFLPLLLISSISIIGLFFVIPYIEACRAKYYYYLKNPIYDKDHSLNELQSLKADKFSFDDFMLEYNDKVERKNKNK
jgi:uncharacterized membrane protein